VWPGPGGSGASSRIRLDHAVEQITARHPSGEEAALLRIPADAPVLIVVVTAYDATARPIQVSDLVLPGQRHELRDAYPFA
jgi:GntR family transcriptional regulator